MSPLTDRRHFLRAVAAGAVSLGSGGNCAIAAPGDDAGEWAFPLLGDLHYDRLEHHDLDWLRQHHPGDVSQVENYSRITRDLTPRLLSTVAQRAGNAGATVPFIIQLGDLLEGLCGTEALARRQADDALDAVRAARLPAPLLFTKGNHDVTGPGAVEIYNRVLVPFLAAATNREVNRAAFTRRRGDTLLVFYDAYDRGSLDWFESLLREQRPRRLLFVIHPPVVPYNARSSWHIYSSPRQERERGRLLTLLGQHRAIVLSGHLHKYSFLVRRTETGRFVQLALSSVASTPDGRPRDVREGIARYGPDLVELEPRHAPDTVEQRRRLLEAERPWIEQYEYADTWGHAMLRVNGDRVRAEVFRGFEADPWKRLDLTGPLA
jgi:hypothetical protein